MSAHTPAPLSVTAFCCKYLESSCTNGSYNVQIRTVSEFKHCAYTHHRVLPHWSEVVSRDHLSAHLQVCVLLAIITIAMDTSLADIVNGD